MTYYESAKDITISRKRARQELKAHGVVNLNDFFEEVGFFPTYKAQEVLEWLGY